MKEESKVKTIDGVKGLISKWIEITKELVEDKSEKEDTKEELAKIKQGI